MAKRPRLTTTAGNRIGDNQNSIKAGAHEPVLLQDCQRVLKTARKTVTASAVAFSAFAFTATPGSADSWSPATVPVCTENLSSGVVVVKSAKDGV